MGLASFGILQMNSEHHPRLIPVARLGSSWPSTPMSAWHPPTRPSPCSLSLHQYGSLEQGWFQALRAALVAGLDRQVLGFGFFLEESASWLLRISYYSGEKWHEGKSMGRVVCVSLCLSSLVPLRKCSFLAKSSWALLSS